LISTTAIGWGLEPLDVKIDLRIRFNWWWKKEKKEEKKLVV
jgi:hypothetical protein